MQKTDTEYGKRIQNMKVYIREQGFDRLLIITQTALSSTRTTRNVAFSHKQYQSGTSVR